MAFHGSSFLSTTTLKHTSGTLQRLKVTEHKVLYLKRIMLHRFLAQGTLRARATFSRSIFAAQQHVRTITNLDRDAVADLFAQYAVERNGVVCLDRDDLQALRAGIGEDTTSTSDSVCELFQVADLDGNGYIDFDEFLENAAVLLESNPARIILVVGGPGSGKGLLCSRLASECGVVHLSSGDLLRNEVERQSPLGKEVKDIMGRGELVSSAIIVTLMKKHMGAHPGKRVLLDGFPRSLENARDLTRLCGVPELALHLDCADTVMLERIMERGSASIVRRQDDNFQTAIHRIRTFHKYHNPIMEWLHEQHVPVVNLDCSGTPESVWKQLMAIGRLMRPAVKLKSATTTANDDWNQSSGGFTL